MTSGAVVAALSLVLSVSLTTPAAAKTPGSSLLASIAAADPSVLQHVTGTPATAAGNVAISSTEARTSVTVPTAPSAGITVKAAPGSGRGNAVTLGLPFADEAAPAAVQAAGVVSYDNGNGSVTVPVVKDDGSVQINTVIANSSAPTRYAYPVSVPGGGSLQPDDQGSVSVLDAKGIWVAGFAVPWAKDAHGAAVPTHFEVSNNTLVQVVDLTSAPVAYPVVADPWLFINLIANAKWVTLSKWSPTLAVFPTWYGRYGPAAARWAAWSELITSWSPASNTPTMQTQFYCHWDAVRLYAPNKPSWNLDSKRPNASELTYINYGCNYPDGPSEW